MTIISLEKMENFITKDQRQTIVRGKRTKRSRSRLSAVSPTSSSGGSDENDDDNVYLSIPTPSPSENSGCTEEDEDMANCLILLAQSGGGNNIIEKHDIKTEEKFFNTPKFTEITTTNDKTGFYVYECKTCNRSFASFQALGGHRASHKKPKDKKSGLPSNNINEGELSYVQRENEQIVKWSPSLSFHKSFKYDHKPKVHECSICGSEFSSGQALGGHMRCHRSVTTTNNNGNTIVEETYENKPRNILQLDLNLPAPEDDHRDTKFPFVFVAPALVGCHY